MLTDYLKIMKQPKQNRIASFVKEIETTITSICDYHYITPPRHLQTYTETLFMIALTGEHDKIFFEEYAKLLEFKNNLISITQQLEQACLEKSIKGIDVYTRLANQCIHNQDRYFRETLGVE